MSADGHIAPAPAAPDLYDAVAAMRRGLARDCAALTERVSALVAGAGPPPEPPAPGSGSALDTLAAIFRLSALERALVCLAAGPDLDPALGAAVGEATGAARADVSLALTLFGAGAWDALCPAAPLRGRRLVTLAGPGPMLRRRLEVDERVLHFLMGLNYLDADLEGVVRPLPPLPGAADTPAAQRIVAAWSGETLAVLLLAGPDPVTSRAALAGAAATLGLTLYRIDAADIPAEAARRHDLAALLDRELAFGDGALLIEGGGPAAARLTEALSGPTAIAGPDPEAPGRGPRLRIDIAGPGRAGQRAIWREVLGPRSEALGDGLDRLAGQFTLDRTGVAAAAESLAAAGPVAPGDLFATLWQAAREQGRQRLDGLAERIDSRARWDDLVLPAAQKAQLAELAAHVGQAWRVGESWGWRARSPRGLGAAALFAGPSGTGKTFAAEVLAGRLALDLYRIDLSQVVSKYIGETEKNLARIFTAAERGGAILLFDEADALFGKRSEVRDSHDRYANIEVSYLLQRMEAYPGLAILTTNQRAALDSAFLRRLRFVVPFPFPDAAARAEIWARVFPAETPTAGLDPARLARLSLTGGAIRSIALNASFLAADAGGPVTAAQVLAAARREYAKLEKPFTTAEQEALR